MADPVWLDTCIVAQVANGDRGVEAELAAKRGQGHELLLTPQSNQELLFGNPLTMRPDRSVSAQQPSPHTRVVIQQTISRLGITVDMEAGKLPMATRVGYAMQDHVRRPRNVAVPPSLNNISQSDSLVLSQVKAGAEVRGVRDPVIFTAETGRRGMISQAGVYGVKAITPKGWSAK